MSRQIILMRHGDVDEGNLTALGKRQAQSIAKQLIERGDHPDAFIHSSKLRARQTVDAIMGQFKAAGFQSALPKEDSRLENSRKTLEALNAVNDAPVVLAVAHRDEIFWAVSDLAGKFLEPEYGEAVIIEIGDNGSKTSLLKPTL